MRFLRSLPLRLQRTVLQASQRRSSKRASSTVPLAAEVEVLEKRSLLTTFLVTTLEDEDLGAINALIATADGSGLSLREAIRIANENGGGPTQGENDGDIVHFAGNLAGGRIDLDPGLGQLFIGDDLNIDGTDQDQGNGDQGRITVSAGGNHRVFEVNLGGPFGGGGVDFQRLVITNGRVEGFGGGILAQGEGTVRLGDTILSNNTASFGGGAAVFTGAEFKLDFSTAMGNLAMGTPTVAGGAGGAIFMILRVVSWLGDYGSSGSS